MTRSVPSSQRWRLARDWAIVGIAFCVGLAGLLGIGFAGDVLLNFYIFFALASFGTLIMLATGIASSQLWLTGISNIWLASFAALIAFLTRAFLAFKGPQLSFDLHWYADYVTFLRMHVVPYTAAFYFPYPQGFLDFLDLFVNAPNPLVAIHWSLIAVDAVVAFGTFHVLRRFAGSGRAFWGALAYAIYPMPVIEVGRMGHFETLLNLCFIVLVYALSTKRAFLTGFSIMAAATLKVFPIVGLPVLAFTWIRQRNILLGFLGAAVAFALSLMPFIAEIDNIMGFWIGTSVGSPAATGGFAANSLPALVRDLPLANIVIRIAQGAALVILVVLTLYAWSKRKTPATAAPIGSVVATQTPAPLELSVSHRMRVSFGNSLFGVHAFYRRAPGDQAPSGVRWPRVALALFWGLFLVYGCYVAMRPWLPSQYAYNWWYPTPLLVSLGICLIGLAIIGLFLVRREKVALAPEQGIALLLATLIAFIVLLHPNVNPWYLMPLAVLFLCALPSRSAIVALGCLCAFYASYFNSTSFAKVGWPDTTARASGWRATYGPVPSSQQAGSIKTLADSQYAFRVSDPARDSFLVLAYSKCIPPSVTFTLPSRSGDVTTTQVVVGDAAIYLMPAHTFTTGTLRIQAMSCAPTVRILRAVPTSAKLVKSDSLAIGMRAARAPGGWSPWVSVTADLATSIFQGAAVAFDVVGDTDPTFHHQWLAMSVALSGQGRDGSPVEQISILKDDVSTTSLGPIRYRIPVFDLPTPLRKVNSVTFSVRAVAPSSVEHWIYISNVRAVTEPRWDSSTAVMTLLLGVILLGGIGVFLLSLRLSKHSADEDLQ